VSKNLTRFLSGLDDLFGRIEVYALVFIVALMLVMAAVQVVLKFLGHGAQWLEMLLRALVVWVGFLGGAVASKQSRHITIDVVSRFTKGVVKRVLTGAVNICASAGSAFLGYIAIGFIAQKMEHKSAAFSMSFGGEVEEYLAAIVIPIGLFLMAFHFFVAGFLEILALNKSAEPATNEVDV
jgi:TRAP-type C4-dicarboxylate transport system permease small subunit